MFTHLPNPLWPLVPSVVLLVCFTASIRRDPRRLRNGPYLFAGIWLGALAGMFWHLSMDVAWNALVLLTTATAVAPPLIFAFRALLYAALVPFHPPEYPFMPIAGMLAGLCSSAVCVAWSAAMVTMVFAPRVFYAVVGSPALMTALAVAGVPALGLSVPFVGMRLYARIYAGRSVDPGGYSVMLVQGRTVDGDRLDEWLPGVRPAKGDPLLTARLDRAAELWIRGGGAALLAVGGVRDDDGSDDTIHMRDLLTARGVPKSAIAWLGHGTLAGNLEAFEKSGALGQSDARTAPGVLLIVDGCDMLRASAVAMGMDLPSAAVAAPVPFGRRSIRMIREYSAVVREHWVAFGAPMLVAVMAMAAVVG
ncbi:ElyC/SanA/YdcF family protein [Bifidobacterium avesanii]|uniref:YdcF family protein n=1 Tax=Bifidobacterium avesanii TaxID=1798157 RepID=A0A7K3TFD8_9BIFI|nr:ElyC/SanA/YdcF family protein [Bifidobacterium avesanii]KAB8295398.1 hypothetical protein DSM100685_0008 [Bifidobacterium avesanii]NEG77404.1 hypothetical protein [Bifidobacterium avesanii]